MAPDSRTVTVEAVGRREATPSSATVEATVTGDADTVRDANALADDAAATLRDSLAGGPAAEIQTVDVQVQAAEDMFDPPMDTTIRATRRLHIECAPADAESVVEHVLGAGATVQGVRFHLDEATHRRRENEALTAAMQRAREKAERLAAAEGLAVGAVREISPHEETTEMDDIVDEALSAGSDDNVVPTPVTVSAGVTVVYELESE